MEHEGFVSIWLGNFVALNDLMEYAADDTFDEDGNNIPSRFASDFFDVEKQAFDPDFFELGVCEPSDSLLELVNEFSYGDSFVVEGIKLKKTYNAVILVYDFKYVSKSGINAPVDFIAAVPYKKDVMDF
ncbi:MAG: immunity 22 family protein [Oscillospiraceae bacterium]|nr:immunity 22 family protein [Oscillospiraceae bacterium]